MTEIKSCEDHIKVHRDTKNKSSSSSSRCEDSLNSCFSQASMHEGSPDFTLSSDDCNKSRTSERNGKGAGSKADTSLTSYNPTRRWADKGSGETKVDTATASLRPTTQIAPLTMDNLLTKSLETTLKEKIALNSAAGHDWLIETNLRLEEGKDQQNGKTTDTVDDVDAVLIDGQADEQKSSTGTLQIHNSLIEHEQPEKHQQIQQDTESLQEREEQNAAVIDTDDVDAAMNTDGRSDEQKCSTGILRIHDNDKYTNHIEEHDQPEMHRRVHSDEQISCESFEEQEMDTPEETSTDAALDIDDEMIFDCTTVEQTCTMQTSRTTDTKSYREYEQNERPQTLKSNSSEPTTPREQSNTIPSPVFATFGLTGVPQDIMLDIPKLCRQLSGERKEITVLNHQHPRLGDWSIHKQLRPKRVCLTSECLPSDRPPRSL
ncbi:hypothetical protein BSL78_05297 [Apostichopus japonicus]|uniref:Uncharacterized protein n=1 Tax=Stichopus japonicus TaxID=307972 RepID=A0A2G8LBZ4_STIJA|nr:hypothetical protein BSL78_05297 [Apostichopus japonicus]